MHSRTKWLLLFLGLTIVFALIMLGVLGANRVGTKWKGNPMLERSWSSGMGAAGAILAVLASVYGIFGVTLFNDLHLPSFGSWALLGVWFISNNTGAWLSIVVPQVLWLPPTPAQIWPLGEVELAFGF